MALWRSRTLHKQTCAWLQVKEIGKGQRCPRQRVVRRRGRDKLNRSDRFWTPTKFLVLLSGILRKRSSVDQELCQLRIFDVVHSFDVGHHRPTSTTLHWAHASSPLFIQHSSVAFLHSSDRFLLSPLHVLRTVSSYHPYSSMVYSRR